VRHRGLCCRGLWHSKRRTAQQSLPEFTLGEKSNPTDEQVDQLCQCIWNKLGSWEKRVADALSKGDQPTEPLPSPDLNVRAFAIPERACMPRQGLGSGPDRTLQNAEIRAAASRFAFPKKLVGEARKMFARWHRALDAAVDRLYKRGGFSDDRERVEYLSSVFTRRA
jgi:hypothetical protein